MSGVSLPKIAFLHVEREEAAPAAPWAAMRQNHPSLGPGAHPYLPRCVPPPRPARSLPCSAGSWTVHPPGRSGQTGIKGKASLRGLSKPHCPPRQHHKGKGYNFGQDYVTGAETLVHFYLHRREQAKPHSVSGCSSVAGQVSPNSRRWGQLQ